MKKLLLLFAVCLTALTASAIKVDGIYYTILSEEQRLCEVKESPDYNYSGDIVIPSTFTYNEKTYTVVSIEANAFEGCSKVTSVVIPNSVNTIGYYAFKDCTGLTSVEIPNSVTWIGDEVFSHCSSLTSVVIPNSVTSIGDKAFSTCKSLTSVEIPSSVTNINDEAFYNCSSLTSVVIPNKITRIGNNIFTGCSSLTSVVIPNSVLSIGNGAFQNCSSLTSVVIPNSVKEIENYAFANCTNLKTVEIGNSVEQIGAYSFKSCTGLKEIISLNPEPPYAYNNSSFYEVPKTDCVVKVPDVSVEHYKAANGWKEFFNIIAYDPTNISETLFNNAQHKPVYNLHGVRVGEDAKGIVIRNGKKILRK